MLACDILKSNTQTIVNNINIIQPCNHTIISFIALYRSWNPSFKRQTQYIAISIIESYWSTISLKGQKCIKHNQYTEKIYAIAAILLSIKFNDTQQTKLRSIIQYFSLNETNMTAIIETEGHILQKLDFSIPNFTAFSSLSYSLYNREKQRKNQKKIVQCLKIFVNYIKINPSIIVDTKFGQELYQYIFNGRCTLKVKQCMKSLNKAKVMSPQLRS